MIGTRRNRNGTCSNLKRASSIGDVVVAGQEAARTSGAAGSNVAGVGGNRLAGAGRHAASTR